MSDTILYASNNTGAILTSTAQGPNGALASPTGTGVVLAASSAIVGTALGGTVIGQVLTWAGSQWVASTPANQSPTGTGVVLASGGAFVSPALPGTAAGQALIWSGSQWVAIAIGTNLIAQSGAASGQALVWGGSNWGPGALNLAGGSNFVSGDLPVANIAPGTNGYVLTTTGGAAVWAAPAASGITQLTGDVTAGPGSGSQAATVVAALAGLLAFTPTTGTITWATTAAGPGLAQTIAASGAGRALTMTPQASASGTGGPFVVALAAPTGAGVETFSEVTRAGVLIAAIGADPANAAVTCLWLGSGFTPTDLTATVKNTGSVATLQGSNNAGILINGSYALYASSSDVVIEKNLYVGTDPGAYAGGAGVLGLAKAGMNPSAPISTGGVIYADSSTGAICLYPAGVTGWQFQAANGTCYSAAVLQVGTTLAVNGAPTGPGGGGVGVIAMNNATTQPTAASVSGGVALSASAGTLKLWDASALTLQFQGTGITFGGGTSNMTIGVTAGGAVSAGNLNITGQTVTNPTGGLVAIAGGGGSTTGGAVTITTGAATTNGALTLSSGSGTVYNATGGISSGNTPGAWVLNGPAFTVSQLTTTVGKSTLSATACYAFIPTTINGVTCQLIVSF